jgi:hypothetical protein
MSGSTFTQGNANAGGGAYDLVLTGGSLAFTGTGAGTWDLLNGIGLSGNTVAGQTVKVMGTTVNNSAANLAANMTNGGALIVTTTGGGYGALFGGQTITNTGTITYGPSAGGSLYLRNYITNNRVRRGERDSWDHRHPGLGDDAYQQRHCLDRRRRRPER